MPDRSGVAMQIFDYSAMAANTTAATEGTPGSGQSLTQNTRTLTLSNYVDYISFSHTVVMTQIDDAVAAGAKQLAYRGALSVDTVISTAADTAANSDSTSRIEINDGSYFSAAKARQAAMSLRSSNVKPKENGKFYGVISSLQAFDLLNDSATGGFIDLQKFQSSERLLAGVTPQNFVGEVGGINFWESNSLPTETNWQSSSHNAYHCYVFGMQAFIASSLGKTKLGQKNFTVNVNRYDQGNSLDPAATIQAAASYNFFFGVTKTTGSTNKFRRIRSESSIG